MQLAPSCKHGRKPHPSPVRSAGAETTGRTAIVQMQTHLPIPSFRMTLKSRAICTRSLPTLLVAYRRTAPPSLQSRTRTSGPIHRVSLPWLVRGYRCYLLPPGIEIRELYTSIRKVKGLAASQAGREGKGLCACPYFFPSDAA